MRSSSNRQGIWLAAGLLLAVACSVLAPHADRSRYFMLESTSPSAVAARAEGPSLGFGPIEMPEYLKRREMITRSGPHELRQSATDRWAEPLDVALPRVLGQNVVHELGGGRTVPFPWYENERPEFQIRVAIERFEPDPTGDAVLDARWTVRELGPGGERIDGETRARHTPVAPESEAVAEALSACVADLGADIAREVRRSGRFFVRGSLRPRPRPSPAGGPERRRAALVRTDRRELRALPDRAQ